MMVPKLLCEKFTIFCPETKTTKIIFFWSDVFPQSLFKSLIRFDPVLPPKLPKENQLQQKHDGPRRFPDRP
jgi:hypothetical protein